MRRLAPLTVALSLMTGCATSDRYITIEERVIDAGSLAPLVANATELTVREGDKAMRTCVSIEISQKGRVMRVRTPACELQKD